MKLTIEETDGSAESIPNIRHVSTTDTKYVVEMWWEGMDGSKHKYDKQYHNPKRIVLEFE